LLEGIGVKGGRDQEGTNSIAGFLFIPSFGGLHAGLCHQVQGPKMVEATIHQNLKKWRIQD
jgi:hypothetical protein